MSVSSHPDAERLAELHWIAYYGMSSARGMRPPMWHDLPEQQRDALIGGMDIMLSLEHVKPGY